MWSRRPRLDIRNGVILACLAFIVLLSVNLNTGILPRVTPNFTPEQKAIDNGALPDSSRTFVDIRGSHIELDTPVPIRHISESEAILSNGLTHFTRQSRESQPALLILVLTQDASSWGHDVNAPDRTFHDFLDVLISTHLDLSALSLGIWTTCPDQYALFRSATLRLPLARVSIILSQGQTSSVPRELRHNRDPAAQKARRSAIAQLRNTLMLRTLASEPHVLWIDADVNYLSPGIVQRMLSHSEGNAEAGIITARCHEGPTYDYDKNAWAGTRGDGKVRQVAELIKRTGDDELVRLDSVGGTILFIRAELVWRGLRFPSSYVIGTGWGREGNDGIETEGLCYVAKDLEGGGCWVLGGANYVGHTNL